MNALGPACVSLLVLLCSVCRAEYQLSKVCSIEQLSEKPPVGRLGQPLGTVIVIEGTYRLEPDGEIGGFIVTKTPWRRLRVDKVNGTELSAAVEFEIDHDLLIQKLDPKHGEPFRLRGFETGGFVGYPEEAEGLLTDTVARAYGRMAFHSSFYALRDEVTGVSEKDAFKPRIEK